MLYWQTFFSLVLNLTVVLGPSTFVIPSLGELLGKEETVCIHNTLLSL
jgi:hypothetical protein